MINNMTLFLDDLVTNKTGPNGECDDHDNNRSLTFDIGYPLKSGKDIKTDSSICCRADQSCANTNTIRSGTSHILCTAHRSCAGSGLIRTESNGGSIYCVANGACADSTLESRNTIMCSSVGACQDTLVLGAKTLYCVGHEVCNGLIIRSVENIYFIRAQGDVIVYSGDVGVSNIYFKGQGAGSKVSYYCEENGLCNIDCEKNACDKSTKLYCDGKCRVACGDDEIEDGNNCVEIVESQAPSVPPTPGPVFVIDDESLIDDSDISSWFNWTVGGFLGVSALIIIIGYIDAFYVRNNDLYEWTAIAISTFYTNDFISDVFFSLKLANLSFYEDLDEFKHYRSYFLILFTLSVAFIIIPFFGNVIPLHLAVGKWSKNPILKDTGVFLTKTKKQNRQQTQKTILNLTARCWWLYCMYTYAYLI